MGKKKQTVLEGSKNASEITTEIQQKVEEGW